MKIIFGSAYNDTVVISISLSGYNFEMFLLLEKHKKLILVLKYYSDLDPCV